MNTRDAVDALGLPSPRPARRTRGRATAIWIVPVLAVIVAAVVGVRAMLRAGPTVEITFETAEGLEAGQSELRFRNVPVGKVERIAIADDRKHIIATVRLTRDAASLAAVDSRFWVERPRIGVGGVSGLGTVLTGAYIGVDAGVSKERTEKFVGLEKPPGVTRDRRGQTFRVTAPDAGSLAVASPVYYKRVQVGWIASLELAPDGKQVSCDVFIEDPHANLVTASTVFWNASGLDVTIDAGGLRLDTQSLATVVAGGIAFSERDGEAGAPPAEPGHVFALYSDRGHAMAKPDERAVHVAMRFADTTRGVGVGTSLDFRGVTVGQVDTIAPGFDARAHRFYTDVLGTVYPARLGGAAGDELEQVMQREHVVRAQIKSGNIVTGAAYIGLVYEPGEPLPVSPVASIAALDGAIAIPTEPGGGIDHLQDQISAIVAKIDRIPFQKIGDEVAKSVESLRTNVAASDSRLQESVHATLQQVENAARSVRTLTDYLARHPEAILRGRK